jgi:hypothetical protein
LRFSGISFLVAAVNGYDIITVDVQNYYVQATSLGKYVAVAGDEFGDDKGKRALLLRALYGFKSSGASWPAHIAHNLTDMNFTPSHGELDVWMRMAFNQTKKASYWEYLLVYVDDLLDIGLYPRPNLYKLEMDYNYVLEYFCPRTRNLGASIITYNLDETATIFFMAPDHYLVNAISIVQRNHQKHGIKLNSTRSDVPMTLTYGRTKESLLFE